eukprot:GHVS01073181.1.p1 GENE.GHVS01073181.1~~GHVS01073181.1.p1  ORF type:complete len:204 (+),score=15.17 GHVS01073181.1:54-665(+)
MAHRVVPIFLVLMSAGLVTAGEQNDEYYSSILVKDAMEQNGVLRIFVTSNDMEDALRVYNSVRREIPFSEPVVWQQVGEAIEMKHTGGEVSGWVSAGEAKYEMQLYKETSNDRKQAFYVLFFRVVSHNFHFAELAPILEVAKTKFSHMEDFEKEYFEKQHLWFGRELYYRDAFSIICVSREFVHTHKTVPNNQSTKTVPIHLM